MNRERPAPPVAHGFRIPDLCAPRAVLFLCLLGALLALLLVLYASGLRAFDWISLGETGVLLTWNLLASAGLLCALRERIARWPLAAGAAVAYALVLLVCLLSHLAQAWIYNRLLGGAGFAPDWLLLGRDLLIGALVGGAVLRYFYLQGELIERERAELDARIRSLQARIRPHFLFNSMNIIASLIAHDPEHAERAVEDLSELFRASLREGATTVPLATELELCDRYLRLEGLRLGARLAVERHIDVAVVASAQVPQLCLQPLIENAVYHGIQPLQEGGTIVLRVGAEGARLRIEIDNPLPAAEPLHGSGIAQANVRARLAAIYGDSALLQLEASAGRYRALLELPRRGVA